MDIVFAQDHSDIEIHTSSRATKLNNVNKRTVLYLLLFLILALSISIACLYKSLDYADTRLALSITVMATTCVICFLV